MNNLLKHQKGDIERNKKKNKDDQNKKYTLYIKATCVFGGVDIK